MPSQEQLAYLNRVLAYCNFPEWWAAGFKGGGNHWDMESGVSDHGDATENSIVYASPLGKVICTGNMGTVPTYTVPYQGKIYTVEQFIEEFQIKFLTKSIGGKAENGLTEEAQYWLTLRNKYNLIINNSAGNDGEKGGDAALPSAAANYWCACGLNDNGVPMRDGYSSVNTENDFTMFTSFLEGTSFSSPMGDGMEDVICSRYGYDKTHDWMYSYLRMICKDLQVEGFDAYTGWGIPILPPVKKRLVEMMVGSKLCFVDNVGIPMDSSPVTKTTKDIYGQNVLVVFVPLRTISELFGKTVKWAMNMDKSLTITISDEAFTTVITTGASTMTIYKANGTFVAQKPLLLPAFIDQYNRTQVPLRAISEAFNNKVGWVQSEKKIMILEK